MKALAFNSHGDISTLAFREVAEPCIRPGWSILSVRAVALNHLDIWVRRGWPGLSLPLPHWTGSDIVGTVTALDQSAPADCSVNLGDRVAVIPGYLHGQDEWTDRGEESESPLYRIIGEDCPGGLAERVAVPTECLVPVPETVSDPVAAAFLLTGTTVWRMLFSRGALRAGETVLVVGAGGGVNSLAVLLAKRHGASVIVVAGTPEKERFAAELGADMTICYRQKGAWHHEVLRLTGGRGVDLVVDNVGAATFDKSLKSLRRGGRLLTVGNTAGPIVSLDNRLIFSKQLSIIGSTMGSRKDFAEAIRVLWCEPPNVIERLIDSVAPFERGIEMMARLESGEQSGKIVLSMGQ